MTISAATIQDAPRLANIMASLARYYVPNAIDNQDLPDWLLQSMTVEAFVERLQSDSYQHWVYRLADEIIGYIALKRHHETAEFTHLYHLFVCESYHKKGIAQALWEHVSITNAAKHISLRSSLYAVAIYEKFGFTKTGNVQYKDGLAFQPMQFHLT